MNRQPGGVFKDYFKTFDETYTCDSNEKLAQQLKSNALYPSSENASLLGEGSWGAVWQWNTDTSKVVKIVKYTDEEEYERTCREITVGKDNVINTNNTDTPIVPAVFRTAIFKKLPEDNTGTIIFEQAYAGPTLQDFLKRGNFTPVHNQHFALLLLKNLNILHRHGYTHRDTKPDNLFVYTHKGKQTICIGDHGMVSMENAKARKSSFYFDYVYWPPEMQENSDLNVNNTLVDSWGVGKCILECFCESHRSTHKILNSEQVEAWCRNLKFPPQNSALWTEVLKGLLNTDPNDRLSISDAYNRVADLDTITTAMLLFFVEDSRRCDTPVEADANWTFAELRTEAMSKGLDLTDKHFLKGTVDRGFDELNSDQENENWAQYIEGADVYMRKSHMLIT
jgi:serine/threonine protein kinase